MGFLFGSKYYLEKNICIKVFVFLYSLEKDWIIKMFFIFLNIKKECLGLN